MIGHAPPPPAIDPPAHTEAPLRIVIPVVTRSPEPCPSQASGEIVVCASDPEAFRLRPLPETYRTEPPRAEMRLGNGISAAVTNEQAGIGGVPSNRIKATLKIEF